MSSDKKHPEFNHPAPAALDLLLSRRSGSAKAMKEPGPSKKQLGDILKAGRARPTTASCFPGALSCSKAKAASAPATSWPR